MKTIKDDASTWGVEAGNINNNFTALEIGYKHSNPVDLTGITPVQGSANIIYEKPFEFDGHVREVITWLPTAGTAFTIEVYNWNGLTGGSAVWTLVSSLVVENSLKVVGKNVFNLNIPVLKGQYLGFTGGNYYNAAIPNNDYIFRSNNSRNNNLYFFYKLYTEAQSIQLDISNNMKSIDIDYNRKRWDSTLFAKAYGNVFTSGDWTLLNSATISGEKFILDIATKAIRLTKAFWSYYRVTRCKIKVVTHGKIGLYFSRNGSFDASTGDNTSKFYIDTTNGILNYFSDSYDPRSIQSFTEGREYIVELEQSLYFQKVRIIDYLTGVGTETLIGTGYANYNGTMCQNFEAACISGSFEVSDIGVFVKKGALLAMLGDSITADNFRVPAGKNFSAIVSNELGDTVIVAMGGMGAFHADAVFANEVAFMKPKYCSYHMAVNGGITQSNIEKFIDDCIANGIIPIVCHAITSATNYQTLNGLIDAALIAKSMGKAVMMDIATSINNDPAQGKNTALYALSGTDAHPNEIGHEEMAKRFLLDIVI